MSQLRVLLPIYIEFNLKIADFGVHVSPTHFVSKVAVISNVFLSPVKECWTSICPTLDTGLLSLISSQTGHAYSINKVREDLVNW